MSRPVVERRSPDRLDAHRLASLAQALALHALVHPRGVALVTESGTLTSAELCSQVARALPLITDRSGATRRPVAVVMDGSVESVVAAVAVLTSPVPLVPVDHHQPDARRAQIMALTGAIALDPYELAASSRSRPLRSASWASPTGEQDLDDVATILMTSGSSGAPKGVLLSHRICLDKAYDLIGALMLTSTDRLGNVLPLGFGAGLNTLVAGLLAGVPVVCRDPRSTDPAALRQWLRDERVTTLHSSATLGRALATSQIGGATADLSDLRVVVYYGEPVHGSDVRTTRSGLSSSATVVNWYACTECGVVAFRSFPAHHDVPDGRLAVGRAVRGRRIMVVDDDGRQVAPGDVGEIWIRGGAFALGYLGDLTLPTTSTPDGNRWYRTGDRGRIDDRQGLQVVGRVGSAVKIRGYLVEPSEVESALRREPGVVDAVVEGVEHGGHTELLAHVALDTSAAAVDAHTVRAGVRADLPDWMVPRFVEIYGQLPRTERGKVDRARLRRPEQDRTQTPQNAPRMLRTSDLTVLGVAELVWAAMGRNDIDVDDDLIDVGADSLALTTILAGVAANFHVRIDLARVVAAPSITTIAAAAREEVIADARSRQGMSVLVPLRDGGTRNPLFVVAGAGAPAVSLVPLARHLTLDRPVHALQAWGLENRGRPDRSVSAAARRDVEAIRDVAPHGPYLLAGHSMGAHIAWEIAGQLRESGEEVEAVVLIDPHLSAPMIDHLRSGSPATPPESDEPPESGLHRGDTLEIGLRRLMGIRLKMMVAGLIQFDPLTQWLLFYNLGMAALARHRPRALDVPAAVLRTDDNAHGPTYWSMMARGPLHIDQVPGSHTDLLREPYVSSVARSVDSAIAALHVA